MIRTHDPHNRRVLIIDDNPAIHDDFKKVLGTQYGKEAAALDELEAIILGSAERPRGSAFELCSAFQGENGAECARQALLEGRPFAMAFVDMRMSPGWDGLKTIEVLWSIDPNLQVVICSAYADYDWIEVVERLGRPDKLLVLRKPFEPIEVQQCARALCCKWENETVLREQLLSLQQEVLASSNGLAAAGRELQYLSSHDALTGLPNRGSLQQRLNTAMGVAQRHNYPIALLVCGLSGLKRVKESLGHRAGDALCKEVAQRLTHSTRDIDTVARLSEEEFAIVLSPPTEMADAERVCQRIVGYFQKPVAIEGIDIHANPSIGVAFYPSDGTTADALITHADAAMRAASKRGQNQVQCYAADMVAARKRETIELESDLYRALELQQFELHYQPRVNIRTGAICAAEALLRWRHPTLGYVAPGKFIPFAEESGMITRIGEWVLHEACRQIQAWRQRGLGRIPIAVNVSAVQFRNGALIETIHRALRTAGLEPQALEVEVTESTVMTDHDQSTGVLRELSRMGILVSVDDFGTGYSSLSYLRRLPINTLKIDRSFISELTEQPDDASIIRAIVSLASSLRLNVVAEGVETERQLEILRSLHCHEYQGYLFSKPLSAAAFAELQRRHRPLMETASHASLDRPARPRLRNRGSKPISAPVTAANAGSVQQDCWKAEVDVG